MWWPPRSATGPPAGVPDRRTEPAGWAKSGSPPTPRSPREPPQPPPPRATGPGAIAALSPADGNGVSPLGDRVGRKSITKRLLGELAHRGLRDLVDEHHGVRKPPSGHPRSEPLDRLFAGHGHPRLQD